jgi:phage gp36-like protein
MGTYITHDLDGTTRDLEAVASAAVILSVLRDLPSTAERQTAVDRAIAAAESTAESYLRQRYAVPVEDPPDQLIQGISHIAVWELHRGPAPEHVKSRRDDAIAWFRDVGKGLASLPGVTDTAESSTTGSIRSSAETRLVTRTTMGWP